MTLLITIIMSAREAIARQCRNGGFPSSAVRCGTMDSFDISALGSEPLIIFCVATAGKGEFPGNGRNFWEKINARSADLQGTLGGLKYAVFGLGDSHYWGKGTEDSDNNDNTTNTHVAIVINYS